VLYILVMTGISVAGALLSWFLLEKRFLSLKRFFEYAERPPAARPVRPAACRRSDPSAGALPPA
jgi:hypothetical protein